MPKDDSLLVWSSAPDELDLQPHQVDIWRVLLDLPADSVKSAGSSLSADETERAARFHFPADRDRFIVAHGRLRAILARYVYSEPYELSFTQGEYGKPMLNPNEGIVFNLAHSGAYALIAITRGRKVGVDVERLRPDMEHEKIAHRYFSACEISELLSLPQDQRAVGFFNCWTRKEAYIKGHGLGLSMPLDSFDVSLVPNEPAVLYETRPDPTEAARWTLLSLGVGSDYAAAIAVEGANLEFRCWDWVTD